VNRSGRGSFERVFKRLKEIQAQFPDVVSAAPLCVIGSEDREGLVRMIDFFHDLGFDSIGFIKLRHLGSARTNALDFDFAKFLTSYFSGLDYILEKNRQGRGPYSERMVRIALSKIFGEEDYPFVDWRSPIGDVSLVLMYDYDGEILPSDEARSVRDVFSLGNVHTTTYEDLVRMERTYRTMDLSLRDREPICRQCPYNPYCGVHPILDYARSGDANPLPHESEECLFTIGLLDWTISRFLEDPIPLMRMMPNADRWLADLASSPGQQPILHV
jgi:uncharacterized protein